MNSSVNTLTSWAGQKPTAVNGFDTGSLLMKDIFTKVETISRLEKHVVLIGEIGVGKKRMAEIIHKNSDRSEGPFHTFYCIDVDEAEFQEAFWEHIHFENNHLQIKYDLLEKSGGGTLYIDQVSELPGDLMLNLVHSYLRGCNQLFKYNQSIAPRLIISVNQEALKDLRKLNEWGELLSSLNPISIMVPPLRERKEDIPRLIDIFLDEVRGSDPDCTHLQMSEAAINECINYSWPGNIRQLKNAVLQGAILSHGEVIEVQHMPFSMNWKLPY